MLRRPIHYLLSHFQRSSPVIIQSVSKGQTLFFSTVTDSFAMQCYEPFAGNLQMHEVRLWRERDLWQRPAILIPKRIQRSKRIRAQRSFRVWNNNYTRQLSRNSSAGEFFGKDATSKARKRSTDAPLCIPAAYAVLKVRSLALTSHVIYCEEIEFKTPPPDSAPFSAKFTMGTILARSRAIHWILNAGRVISWILSDIVYIQNIFRYIRVLSFGCLQRSKIRRLHLASNVRE